MTEGNESWWNRKVDWLQAAYWSLCILIGFLIGTLTKGWI